jgi:hypothetical protein
MRTAGNLRYDNCLCTRCEVAPAPSPLFITARRLRGAISTVFRQLSCFTILQAIFTERGSSGSPAAVMMMVRPQVSQTTRCCPQRFAGYGSSCVQVTSAPPEISTSTPFGYAGSAGCCGSRPSSSQVTFIVMRRERWRRCLVIPIKCHHLKN